MFTTQEQLVLEYMYKGYDNKEIARLLFISVHSVKAICNSIFRKANLTNKTLANFINTKDCK